MSDSMGPLGAVAVPILWTPALTAIAAVRSDANSVQQKNAVSTSDFVFAISGKVVLDERSRQTEGNATGDIRILIRASATKSYSLRFFQHWRTQGLDRHSAGRRDVLIEE